MDPTDNLSHNATSLPSSLQLEQPRLDQDYSNPTKSQSVEQQVLQLPQRKSLITNICRKERILNDEKTKEGLEEQTQELERIEVVSGLLIQLEQLLFGTKQAIIPLLKGNQGAEIKKHVVSLCIDELRSLLEGYSQNMHHVFEKTKLQTLCRQNEKEFADNYMSTIEELSGTLNDCSLLHKQSQESVSSLKAIVRSTELVTRDKELGELREDFLRDGITRLEGIQGQLKTAESSSADATGLMDDIFLSFITLQVSIFKNKFSLSADILAETKDLTDQVQKHVLTVQDELSKLSELIGMMKGATPQQRKEIGANQLELRRQQRFLDKSLLNNDFLQKDLSLSEKLHLQTAKVLDEKVTEEQKIGTILDNTRLFYLFTDSFRQVLASNSRAKESVEEMSKILQGVQDLSRRIEDQWQDARSGVVSEIQDLQKSLDEKCNQLQVSLEEKLLRLEDFETKVKQDSKIGENDMLYLTTEIKRNRDQISSIITFLTQQLQSLHLDSSLTNLQHLQLLDLLQEFQGQKRQVEKQARDVEDLGKKVELLESFLIRSLKNQLNDDNKKSQQQIAKIKKGHEELQRKYEGLVTKCNSGIASLETFNDRFDTPDLERVNQLQILFDGIVEEQGAIGSSSQGQNVSRKSLEPGEEGLSLDMKQQSSVGEGEDRSVYRQKRKVTSRINQVVNAFNEINKQIKDGKMVKSELSLHSFILQNKGIQEECESIHFSIEQIKLTADQVESRLEQIVNSDVLLTLTDKYNKKEQFVTECTSLKAKCEAQKSKLRGLLKKQTETLLSIQNMLEMFNPLNYHGGTRDEAENINFTQELNQKIEKTVLTLSSVKEADDKLSRAELRLGKVCEPLEQLSEREVRLCNELEEVKENLLEIVGELQIIEDNQTEIQSKITNFQKENKEIFDQEIVKRLDEGQLKLGQMETQLKDSGDRLGNNEKKLRFFKEQLNKSKSKQGVIDEGLMMKLEELELEGMRLEKEVGDINSKLKDVRVKRQEVQAVLDKIQKNPQGFSPNQIDNLMTNLGEIKDKCALLEEKLATTEMDMETKVKDLDNLVKSSEDKQALQKKVKEIQTEIEDDLVTLNEMLIKLPDFKSQLEKVAKQMLKDADLGGDNEEKKEEIEERLEELEGIKDTLEKQFELLESYKKSKEVLKDKQQKVQTVESMQKNLEQVLSHKNQVTQLYTDVLDQKEQLQEIRRIMGDLDIPTNLARRKKEVGQVHVKLERIRKEHLNLKKTQKGTNETRVNELLKQSEFKIKQMDLEKNELAKLLQELERYPSADFEDFSKNCEILIGIQRLREKTNHSDKKLKDLEEIQSELVRRLSELDLENSTDLLGMKIQELQEMLGEQERHLRRIAESGEEMEGNTSDADEEELVMTIKNEMPDVLQNIHTTFEMLRQSEQMVKEVKISLNVTKMAELRDKVNAANQNVEDAESMVDKLEKEILNWNPQKKLCKRDLELEEVQFLCQELLDELGQEETNTEVELERNREKQRENDGQEMVDKDGKKVDIMGDLVRLEGELQSYGREIKDLLGRVRRLDQDREKVFDRFSAQLPKEVKFQRKRRMQEQMRSSFRHPLKRPAQLNKFGAKKMAVNESMNESFMSDGGERAEVFAQLSLNCQFRKELKEMGEQAKNLSREWKQMEERYANMRREVFKIKQIKLYKPVKGDEVDEMFAGFLNKAKLQIEVERTSANNYIFGTKKILAKIINNRLVIRVGGGFMNAEEFIEHYGRIEMLKKMKQQEEAKNPEESIPPSLQNGISSGSKGMTNISHARRSTMVGTQFKDQIRKTLVAIKPYDPNTKSGNGSLVNSLKKSNNFTNKLGDDPKSQTLGPTSQDLKDALDNLKETLLAQNNPSPSTGFNKRRSTIMGTIKKTPSIGQKVTGSSPRNQGSLGVSGKQVSESLKGIQSQRSLGTFKTPKGYQTSRNSEVGGQSSIGKK